MHDAEQMPLPADAEPQTPGKNKAIALVAILSFVLGGLHLLLVYPLVLIRWSLAMNLVGIRMRMLPPGPGRLSPDDLAILAGVAVAGLAIGGVMIAAGYGLLRRRRWGRLLAFTAGGYTGMLTLLLFVGAALELSTQQVNVDSKFVTGCLGLLPFAATPALSTRCS